jgi:REP element-mobilizing transposase RayT
MPLAYHIVYCAYGFWLPNDPRGSWSTFVGSRRLFRLFGPATKVATPRSLAHRPHDHARRLAAKRELTNPAVVFNGPQAREVALAIGDVAAAKRLTVLACSVMPEHVHLVIAQGRWTPSQIVAGCRARASRRLHAADLWPPRRPIWGKGRWVVFLDTEDDVHAAIRYVERNPAQAGLRPQRWSFVKKPPGTATDTAT